MVDTSSGADGDPFVNLDEEKELSAHLLEVIEQSENEILVPTVSVASSKRGFAPSYVSWTHSCVGRSTAVSFGIAGLFLVVLGIGMQVYQIYRLREIELHVESVRFPDLCSTTTFGRAALRLFSPSNYCTPRVGPIDIQVMIHSDVMLKGHVPQFHIQPGKSIANMDIMYVLESSAEKVYEMIFKNTSAAMRNAAIRGTVPVRIPCLIFPFTLHYEWSSLVHIESSIANSKVHSKQVDNTVSKQLSISPDTILREIKQIITEIFLQIGVNKAAASENNTSINASTNVLFQYKSAYSWNVPPLRMAFQVNDDTPSPTFMTAGFDGFLLGHGASEIHAYTTIQKHELAPVLPQLRDFLMGRDLHLVMKGFNHGLERCFIQEVLNFARIPVMIPAKVHGQRLIFRDYKLWPKLNKLDDKSRQCNLSLSVEFDLHNPLPISVEITDIRFGVVFSSSKTPLHQLILGNVSTSLTPLVHWSPYTSRTITFLFTVSSYEICQDLISYFLQKQLVLGLNDGNLDMKIADRSFKVPFSFANVHIQNMRREKDDGVIENLVSKKMSEQI